MARAKRTNRAEARRRYRAALAEEADVLEGDEGEEGVATAPAGRETRAAEPAVAPRPRRRAAPAAPLPPRRPGLGWAFRNSFRSPDVGADLRALPSLLPHRSVWLPVLVTVGSAIFFAAVTPQIPAGANASGSAAQIIASLLFQYFVFSPPVASIFLAGFMAPRASYLTGAIAGLAGAISFALVVGGRVGPFVQLDDAQVNQYIASGLVTSPLAGIFFGGAAGWYRRFLTLANPNRGARPASARPGDRPRRKSEPRPLLARRR